MAVTTQRTRTPRISIEELARLPSFYLPTLSWKRDKVAIYWDKTGRLELHVMDLATREIRQVSHGEVPRALRTGFTWTRDDRRILFGRDVEGNEQHDLFKIDVESCAVTQLTSGGLAEHHAIEVGPNDDWLVVNANRRRPETPDKPGQMNLWRIRLDGSDLQPLTSFAFPAYGGRWSWDGRWIAFNANDEPSDLKNWDGYVVSPDGSQLRRVLHQRLGSKDFVSEWHPDSRRLAIASDVSGVFRPGILDVETGEVRWFGIEGVEEHGVRFSEKGRYFVCLRNREAQMRVVVYDLETGEGRELKLPAGYAYGAQFFADDRQILVTYMTDTRRQELIAYELASDRFETLLAAEYGSIDPATFVESRDVRYPSFDGLEVPAILYAPREIGPGERLPAIVSVHGGPTAQWIHGFDPYAQFLVDRGYVVLEPNIRGSTGYGVPFRDAAMRDWGGKDLEDVAAGATYLGSLPYVDPERIAVFGGSYGGFMTFVAATKKPDVWKAAVAWVGISDLHKMWDESKEHFRYFLRDQMGDPQKDRALWRDRSAIEFAHQLKAKLLMVHGRNDPRCPVDQSRIFRDRLLELGKKEGTDFEYVEYADEGHGSADIEQKTRTYKLLADYLDRVL